ncbi:MAG: DUF1153 domain-containing protein [Rhodospirillales bacterium]
MTEHKSPDLNRVQGGIRASEALSPNGRPMTLDDLPPPGTERWVIRRKAEVVAGVRGGLITLQEACRRYRLSVDEFRSWERLLEAHGLAGLRATRAKKYRSPTAKTAPEEPRRRP